MVRFRSAVERENGDISSDLFCKSCWNGSNDEIIDIVCKKHELKVGNIFKYNLREFCISHGSIELDMITTIKILRIDREIVKVETNYDFSDIKSDRIKYYNCFGGDTPSLKNIDNKWELVFYFDKEYIVRGKEIIEQYLIERIHQTFQDKDEETVWETDSDSSECIKMMERTPSLD